MPDPARTPIVFTDLDGTLLDHHTYGYEAAVPLLGKLRDLGVPVVANTSKTRSEWLHLAKELENDHAFVVENGSAIYLPDGGRVVFGKLRETILECLSGMKARYDFESYADWNVAGIAAATGLDAESAKRSSEREFSEPLVWKGSDAEKAKFIGEIHSAGLATLQGGRFLHVLGRTDKGKAVDWFRERFPEFSPVIALGDGPNDIAMLQAADIGIVIATPTGRQLDFKSDNRIIRSTFEGPEGWTETMTPLLESLFSD
jgi:mannosyl-3-phosphoglycerate phosphatase family protein